MLHQRAVQVKQAFKYDGVVALRIAIKDFVVNSYDDYNCTTYRFDRSMPS